MVELGNRIRLATLGVPVDIDEWREASDTTFFLDKELSFAGLTDIDTTEMQKALSFGWKWYRKTPNTQPQLPEALSLS